MKLNDVSGKYVVAVSGGVDSVVLLDLLNKQSLKTNKLKLIVAHFDHGIREDSNKDNELVSSLAEKYGLKFYSKAGKLGKNVSEQLAREARYKFLNEVVNKEKADGIITAHHQDDLIETAIINIIRGTGRKGLTSLTSTRTICRPLINYPKVELINYAKKHNLVWQEDSTNKDVKYLRNYIRLNVVPKLDTASRSQFLSIIKKQTKLNKDIDNQLAAIIKTNIKDNKLSRLWLNSLDNKLSKEILATWLRENGLRDFDKPTIERLASTLKTVGSNKKVDIFNKWQILTSADDLALARVER